MLCLLTFEISEDWDGKNFYTGVHGILVLLDSRLPNGIHSNYPLGTSECSSVFPNNLHEGSRTL